MASPSPAPLRRSSRAAADQSPFFRDLASPFSATRSTGGASRLATPGQAAAVSALRRGSRFANSSPPPPPNISLDDLSDVSPEHYVPAVPSPELPAPAAARGYAFASPSPYRSGNAVAVEEERVIRRPSPGSGGWWSLPRNAGVGSSAGPGDCSEERARGSQVDGVVQPSPVMAGQPILLTLPEPMEVARPELPRDQVLATRELDQEQWVTVYGFLPRDTNLVLQEFEKCGMILKHVPGPSDANWIHILYENQYGARKALAKHGQQINSILMIGVKPIDPRHRRYLEEGPSGLHHETKPFSSPLLPALSTSFTTRKPTSVLASSSSSIPTTNAALNGHASGGAGSVTIASPTKSVFSKVMDLMFGL